MGNGEKTDKIMGFIPDLLREMGCIFPFLSDVGLLPRRGIVLVAADEVILNQVIREWSVSNVLVCNTAKTGNLCKQNDLVLVHPYRMIDTASELDTFLLNQDNLKVLITHSFLPDVLNMESNRLAVEWDDISLVDRSDSEEFFEFAHANPKFIQKELELFKTSMIYKEKESGGVELALEATVAVVCACFRETHCEEETEKRRELLRNAVETAIKKSEKYLMDTEVLDAVRRVMNEFFMTHTEIAIGYVEEVENELSIAVSNEKAVLFDEKWVYIPNQIAKTACQSLQSIISFSCIKEEMRKQGVLCCNATRNTNYTVKKVIVNAYGVSMRLHFLKIKKAYFESDDLSFLERRKLCTLENTKEGRVSLVDMQ